MKIDSPNLIGFVTYGISATISAAGSTQGTATLITTISNVVTSATGGSADGVILPTAISGTRIWIFNNSSATVKVYPATGGTINALSANAAYSISAGNKFEFYAISTSAWYTSDAASAGSVTTVALDFGTTPQNTDSFSISDAAATTTSKITIHAIPSTASSALGGDELEMDTIMATAHCLVNGTIIVYVVAYPGPVKGIRNFVYSIS